MPIHSLDINWISVEQKNTFSVYPANELSHICCICTKLVLGQKTHTHLTHMKQMSKHTFIYEQNTMLLNKSAHCGVHVNKNFSKYVE